MFKTLQQAFLRLTNYKYFSECYCAIFMFIALFSWRFDTMIGMSVMLVISAIILLIVDDFTYILPPVIYLLFTINTGFNGNEIPVPMIMFVGVFIIVLLFFLIKTIKNNGFKFKKMKSFWGLLGLGIMNVLPIFWCDTISEGYEMFYIFFFADLAYLVLYLLIVNGIKKVDLKLLATAMSYLALLISFECLYKVIELKDTVSSIFDLWYYMGWGLCNEAGIMISLALPFIFYLMAKTDKVVPLILQSLKIAVGLIGVLLTTSRGSYLCAFGETVILAIALIFASKIRKQYLIYIGTLIVVGLALFFILHDKTIPLTKEIINEVFSHGLDDNGRKELYISAIEHFKTSPLTIILGPGFCCDLRNLTTAAGVQLGPQVFHSTFFQTLVMGGVFGILMLLIHLFQKYKTTIKLGLPFILTIGIGFICVDLYGLIDNTYHMYYFMIPLVIILAVMDNASFNKIKA